MRAWIATRFIRSSLSIFSSISMYCFWDAEVFQLLAVIGRSGISAGSLASPSSSGSSHRIFGRRRTPLAPLLSHALDPVNSALSEIARC
jgi:hypothetical protein